MGLTAHDLAEMQTLVTRLERGSVSRADWSTLAAFTLLAQGHETVVAIAAHGLDEFIRVARPIFHGHAFHYDDYQRIYQRLCRAVAPVAES